MQLKDLMTISPPPTTGGKVRLSIDVTEKLNRELERLAEASGATKADVMRRGLALVKVAIDEQAQGHKLGILDSNRKVLAEIVGV